MSIDWETLLGDDCDLADAYENTAFYAEHFLYDDCCNYDIEQNKLSKRFPTAE